jgi:hypothetical protein
MTGLKFFQNSQKAREADCMGSGHRYDEYRNKVTPALNSKREEFEMLGYGSVSGEQLWDFLAQKKWKKPKEEIRLYEIVADILAIQPGEFMNYTTVEAFKLGSFALDDEDELQELLK